VLFFDADPHSVDPRFLGSIGHIVCPILVVLDHCSDWTVFLVFRDNCDMYVVPTLAHALSCSILTKQLPSSVEIFSLKHTFGWIDLFGINSSIDFTAMTLACFLLRREAYLIIYSWAGTIFNFVQLPESFYYHPW
jgi:hypothetical protein